MYKKKNLLFSSVGDNSSFKNYWINQDNNYDIFIHYYGNKNKNELKWINDVNGFYKTKGWKFNILNDLYKQKKIDILKYDYIAVFDDDIIISSENINKCFEYMATYDLYFGSPCFEKHEQCKITHDITQQIPDNILRFTNFIEVNVPIIKTNILITILNTYNNELSGYGFDYYMLKNYYKIADKIAIFDCITCINPFEDFKINKTKREIHLICQDKERINKFKQLIRTGNAIRYRHFIYKTLQ
jgi:hypothetical protein